MCDGRLFKCMCVRWEERRRGGEGGGVEEGEGEGGKRKVAVESNAAGGRRGGKVHSCTTSPPISIKEDLHRDEKTIMDTKRHGPTIFEKIYFRRKFTFVLKQTRSLHQ